MESSKNSWFRVSHGSFLQPWHSKGRVPSRQQCLSSSQANCQFEALRTNRRGMGLMAGNKRTVMDQSPTNALTPPATPHNDVFDADERLEPSVGYRFRPEGCRTLPHHQTAFFIQAGFEGHQVIKLPTNCFILQAADILMHRDTSSNQSYQAFNLHACRAPLVAYMARTCKNSGGMITNLVRTYIINCRAFQALS